MKALILCLLVAVASATPESIDRWAPTPGLHRIGPVPMTGSMRPAIHGGEYLRAEPYTGQKIKIGDVIDNGIYLHEVISVRKTHVVTRGIANVRADPPTLRANIRYIIRYIEK